MPVQNSNTKISARPDLATQLLQFLKPTRFDKPLCQKGLFPLQPCPTKCSVRPRKKCCLFPVTVGKKIG